MEQDPLLLQLINTFRIDLAYWNRLNTPDKLRHFNDTVQRAHFHYQESSRNRPIPSDKRELLSNLFNNARLGTIQLERRFTAEERQRTEERKRLEQHNAALAAASQRKREVPQQRHVNSHDAHQSRLPSGNVVPISALTEPQRINIAAAQPAATPKVNIAAALPVTTPKINATSALPTEPPKVNAVSTPPVAAPKASIVTAPLSPTEVLEQRWRYATISLSSWQRFDPHAPGNLAMLNIISQRIQKESVEKFAVWLFTCLQRTDLRALFKPAFIDKFLKKLSLAISQHYRQTEAGPTVPLIVVHQFFLNKFTQQWPANLTTALTADAEKLTELFMRQRNAGEMLASFKKEENPIEASTSLSTTNITVANRDSAMTDLKEEKPIEASTSLSATNVTVANCDSAMTDSEERLSDASLGDRSLSDASFKSTDSAVVMSNAFILIDKKSAPLKWSLKGSVFNLASMKGLHLPAAAAYHGSIASLQHLTPVTKSLPLLLLDVSNPALSDQAAAQVTCSNSF